MTRLPVQRLRLLQQVWRGHPQRWPLTALSVLAVMAVLAGGWTGRLYLHRLQQVQVEKKLVQTANSQRQLQREQSLLRRQLQQKQEQAKRLRHRPQSEIALQISLLARQQGATVVALADAGEGGRQAASAALRMELLSGFSAWLAWRSALADRGIEPIEESVEPAEDGAQLRIRGLYRAAPAPEEAPEEAPPDAPTGPSAEIVAFPPAETGPAETGAAETGL